MSRLLEGRTILLSGVGLPGGIGTAALDEVRNQGGIPVITYYPALKERIEKIRSDALAIPCDFSDEEDIARLCATLRAEGVWLDGFLHSVANSPKSTREEGRTFLSMTTDEMIEGLKLNAISFHWLTKHLMGNGDENQRILNEGAVGVAMTFQLGSMRYIGPYWPMAGTKVPLDQIALFLANELGPQGVRIHLLNAGPIKTVASRGIRFFSRLYEIVTKVIPLRRNTTARDVARAICILMSPISEMFDIVLTVDGGLGRLGVLPVSDPQLE